MTLPYGTEGVRRREIKMGAKALKVRLYGTKGVRRREIKMRAKTLQVRERQKDENIIFLLAEYQIHYSLLNFS